MAAVSESSMLPEESHHERMLKPIVQREVFSRPAAATPAGPCCYCNDTGDVHRADGEYIGPCLACQKGNQP